jgi:prepilin-type cleavage/methylation N-terminal domain protein
LKKKKGEKIMTKRYGFTLAEVLITLGIIGVVAAMTMPTLMNSTQGAQYKAAYKKALSALSQAVTLNVALDEWSFADADNSTYKLADMFNSRMNVVRQETGKTNMKDSKNQPYKANIGGGSGSGITSAEEIGNSNVTLFFNDGIMFTYNPTTATNCTKAEGMKAKTCTGFIDVNGIKAPNRIVQCDNTGVTDSNPEDCKINNPTDIYPVVFYDQTVLPNSIAARAVLYSK